jgi:type VI secretion system protein ImpF
VFGGRLRASVAQPARSRPTSEMAARTRKDRLSQPLMHAFRSAHQARDATKRLDLRDESGERVIAGRRPTGRAPITEAMLRREVGHDLEVLMNTINLASAVDLERFEYVRRSILNFGFSDLTHRSIDEYSINDLKEEIEAALTNFEPRLIRESIHATRDRSLDAAELKVRFLVQADLSCEPVDVQVEFIADVELDTGKIAIARGRPT